MKTSKKKLTTDQLFEKRKEIIDLYNKKMPVMQIVKHSGMTWPAVNKAIKLFNSGGGDIELLRPRMGRTSGSGRILTPEQEDEIKNFLYTKRPCEADIFDYKRSCTSKYRVLANISDALINNRSSEKLWEIFKVKDDLRKKTLWCRDSVRELIYLKSGIELSARGVDQYLHRWGFPKTKQNQRPIARCSELIKLWLKDNPLEENHPKVYWLCRERLNTKKKQSIISATDNHRKVFWTVIQGNFSQEKQIDFLRSLAHQSRRPITVVRSHHKHYLQEKVRAWLVGQSNIILAPPLLQGECEQMERDKIRESAVWPEIKREREQNAEPELEKEGTIATDPNDEDFSYDIYFSDHQNGSDDLDDSDNPFCPLTAKPPRIKPVKPVKTP